MFQFQRMQYTREILLIMVCSTTNCVSERNQLSKKLDTEECNKTAHSRYIKYIFTIVCFFANSDN